MDFFSKPSTLIRFSQCILIVLPYLAVAAGIFASSYFFYPSLLVNLLPLFLLWGWMRRIPATCFVGLILVPLLCVSGGSPLYYLFISALVTFSLYPAFLQVADKNVPERPNRVVADWWWVFVCAGGFSVTVFFNTLRLHYNFQTGVWDLGVLDNVFFNIISGNGQSTPTPRCNPDVSHLSIHKSYLYFLMAPIYAIFPRAETLLFLNAVAMTFGSLSLFLFAKATGMDRLTVVLVSLIWVFYAPTQGAAFFQFHESSYAPVFLFLCGWALFRQKRATAFAFFVLTLSVKEDYALTWGPLFLLMGWWSGRKAEGIVMFLCCVLYASTVVLFSQTHDENFGTLFANTGEDTAKGVLSLVVSNPSVLLEALWQPKNLQGASELLLPVALIPLHTLAGILSLILPIGLYYVPSNETLALNRLQYSFTLAGAVFVGLLYSLGRMDPVKRKAWLGVAVVGTFLTQLVWGVGNPHNTIRSGGDFFKVPHLEIDGGKRRAELLELTKFIPDEAAIMTSNTLLPHFSARRLAYGYEVCQMDRDGYFQGNVQNLRWETLGEDFQPEYVVVWKPAGAMLGGYSKQVESEHFEVWKRTTYECFIMEDRR